MHEPRRADEVHFALDPLPCRDERVELTPERLLARILAHGAHDDAATLFREHRLHHLSQSLALRPIADLATHPDARRVRHVDEEPAGERDLRRDTGPLGRDGLLRDLDQDLLAALDEVLDRWRLAPPVVSAVAAPLAALVTAARPGAAGWRVGIWRVALEIAAVLGGVSLVVLVVLLVLHQIGGVEERTLLGTDVDKGCLNSRQHRLDLAQIDIADHAAGFRSIHEQLDELVVFQNGDPRLPRVRVDQNFAFHVCT